VAGNLTGVRVLDLTHECGFLAGKLLGDMGADVVKVEPPGGDPARRRGPFWGGAPQADRSILWLALNTSKRAITLDLAAEAGRSAFLRLVDQADVLLETERPGVLAARGLGVAALRARNPRLIVASITPWGQTGPHAGWRGSDLTVLAASGNLHCTGDPDRAPLRCAMPVSYYHGSLEACVGVSFALVHRERTGQGQHLDIALHEAMIMPNMATASMARMTGYRGQRAGAYFRQTKSVQREIWPCKDGFVSFALRGGPARVAGLIAMVKYMDEHGMASPALTTKDWNAYNHNLLSQADVDALSAEFGAFFKTKTMTEIFARACQDNLMIAPAITAREIVASKQLAARSFFVDVPYPDGQSLRYPGAFAIVTKKDGVATPVRIQRPAPRLGEHTDDVLSERGFAPAEVTALRTAGVLG
jgi:benzylsuccinate CoA-transferase BbsE subunit